MAKSTQYNSSDSSSQSMKPSHRCDRKIHLRLSRHGNIRSSCMQIGIAENVLRFKKVIGFKRIFLDYDYLLANLLTVLMNE